MNKVVKHSIWLTANVAALPVVGLLSAVTGDTKEVSKVAESVAKHASKISKNLNAQSSKADSADSDTAD